VCRGPHEWTTEELEDNIREVSELIESGRAGRDTRFWEGRLESMEKLLKERAEKGTY
jgi:hypothetical protein